MSGALRRSVGAVSFGVLVGILTLTGCGTGRDRSVEAGAVAQAPSPHQSPVESLPKPASEPSAQPRESAEVIATCPGLSRYFNKKIPPEIPNPCAQFKAIDGFFQGNAEYRRQGFRVTLVALTKEGLQIGVTGGMTAAKSELFKHDLVGHVVLRDL